MDRIALLTAEAGSRRKRSRAAQSPQVAKAHADAQQRLDAKSAAAVGKLQRTDTDNLDEHPAADAGPQDSVQTTYCHTQHCQQHTQQLQHPAMGHQQQAYSQHSQKQQQLQGQEDIDGSSGSEVEGPVADDKYIKGTRLVINGWFQACRGCNEPTAHTTLIARRDVPLCPRCQGKYNAMISGMLPPGISDRGAGMCHIEPLHYWLPRVVGPGQPFTPQQRRDFCDSLVLRQDDAWLQLIQMS